MRKSFKNNLLIILLLMLASLSNTQVFAETGSDSGKAAVLAGANTAISSGTGETKTSKFKLSVQIPGVKFSGIDSIESKGNGRSVIKWKKAVPAMNETESKGVPTKFIVYEIDPKTLSKRTLLGSMKANTGDADDYYYEYFINGLKNEETHGYLVKAVDERGLEDSNEIIKYTTTRSTAGMRTMETLFFVGLGLIGAGIYILVRNFFQEEEERAAKEALDVDDKARKIDNVVLKYSKPFFSRYFVPIVEGLKIHDKRKAYKQKLISSGLNRDLTPDEFYAFKLFLIVGAPIVTAIVIWFTEVDYDLWYFPLAGIVGFFYPDLWVSSIVKERHDQARRAMPFIIDLLALSTEAGLDFVGAIQKVVDKAKKSPLVDELEQVLKEIRLGTSRAEALRNMAARLDMSEVRSFVAILVSADQMGASIGKVLRQQSEQIRNERFTRAEKEGAKASQKIMIPLILFIMPAVLIMMFGPFLVSMIQGGGLK